MLRNDDVLTPSATLFSCVLSMVELPRSFPTVQPCGLTRIRDLLTPIHLGRYVMFVKYVLQVCQAYGADNVILALFPPHDSGLQSL